MNIFFSANTAWSMYIFRGDVLRALKQKGYTLFVAVPYDKYYTPLIEQIGCTVIALSIDAKGTNPFFDIKLIFQYIFIQKKHHIEFSFFYTIKPNIYGSIAARFLRIPHIPIVSGLGYTFINNNFITKISHFLYKLSFVSPNEVWFLNHDDCNTFLEKKLMSPSRAKIIPGEGINLDYFKPDFINTENSEIKSYSTTEAMPFIFLLIARMLYDKGVSEFYEAAVVIKKEFPDTRFLLLGAADVKNPSAIPHEVLTEWNNLGIVSWIGETNDVRPVISQADCVVLPSYREGIPRTLMEAAAMEKPLITTDVPGCRDVVDNGVTGFLCEARNANSLAYCYKKMLHLSSLDRIAMGKAGRVKMAQEFDIKLVIKQYIGIIDKE